MNEPTKQAEDSQTLGDELPKEIERCQELLIAYAEIGPVGTFGAAMIKQDIKLALKALSEGGVAVWEHDPGRCSHLLDDVTHGRAEHVSFARS